MQENKLKKLVRMAVRDVAYQYRMGAGFPGDVNRTHPAEIEPAPILSTNTPFYTYGQMGIFDGTANAIKPIGVAQQSDSVDLTPFGAIVRPFPTQQRASTNYGQANIGAGAPPVSGVVDFARSALIMAQLVTGAPAPIKGGRVFIWAAATSGNNIQGGYTTVASAGNTVRLDPRYTYNGPPDAAGVVEISVNI